MDKTPTRLHPLLTAAAISITVFSAVGVASLTGLMPQSIGSQQEAAPVEVSQDGAKAIEPSIAQPAPRRTAKPAKTHPVKPVVEAPKPVVPAGMLATVEGVREVTTPGEHTAVGPIAGGVAGAVIGHQFGGGSGKKVMAVLGALGGAMAGKHIEKQARGEKHWEILVRLEDGSQRSVQSAVQPYWHAGDRVRFVNGTLQPV